MIGEGTDVYGILSGLNLRDGDGNDFNPTSFTQLHDWLLGGSSKYIQYMLSVKLAAMKLNVLAGFVNEGDTILVNGTPTSIGSLMDDANDLLNDGKYGPYSHVATLRVGHAKSDQWLRSEMALLEGALDAACNNQNWFVTSSTMSLLNISLGQIHYDPFTNYLWIL